MSETYNGGITLTFPSAGQTNTSTLMRTLFRKVADHDHSGSGNGVKLSINSNQDDSIDDRHLRLRNNEWLRSRNGANSADTNLLRSLPNGVTDASATSWSFAAIGASSVALPIVSYTPSINRLSTGTITNLSFLGGMYQRVGSFVFLDVAFQFVASGDVDALVIAPPLTVGSGAAVVLGNDVADTNYHYPAACRSYYASFIVAMDTQPFFSSRTWTVGICGSYRAA